VASRPCECWLARTGITSGGWADALVTLVQYGDSEFVYSGAAHPNYQNVQSRLNRLRFVFRSFPINSHPHAKQAAEAAEAAGSLGKFWQMHHLFPPRRFDDHL
jgi:protein-disulfide isomerase